jgi:hypothetical protein
MFYGEILRIAVNGVGTTTYQGDKPLPRHMPASTRSNAKTSGDRIDGEFVMMRTKDGQLIFVGQNGQFIKKY